MHRHDWLKRILQYEVGSFRYNAIWTHMVLSCARPCHDFLFVYVCQCIDEGGHHRDPSNLVREKKASFVFGRSTVGRKYFALSVGTFSSVCVHILSVYRRTTRNKNRATLRVLLLQTRITNNDWFEMKIGARRRAYAIEELLSRIEQRSRVPRTSRTRLEECSIDRTESRNWIWFYFIKRLISTLILHFEEHFIIHLQHIT